MTENCNPTSSKVWSVFIPTPNLILKTLSSLGVKVDKIFVVASLKLDFIACSNGARAFVSSMKSPIGDFIEDTKALAPLEQAIKSNLSEATTKILSTLTPREERVLRMRFGVGMNTDHTLEEVGLQFSVTRERIRQIEAKALRKLKHPSRSKQLKSFLES